MLIDDFNNQDIKIDFTDSDKRIRFIETQCKHFEAPHAGKPFILMLFQKAFIEAIFAIKIYDDDLQKYVRKYQNAMREESRTLEKCTRKNIRGMFFGNPKQKKKKGEFSHQNKGNICKLSAKTGAKEGRNIAVGAVDEVFEMADDSLVMPIRQALSTQDEPLYWELTTEGFTDDGYLDHRLADGRKVIKGELSRPRWLIWLYTHDSEEEIWRNMAR